MKSDEDKGEIKRLLTAAIDLIATVPGYADIAAELRTLLQRGYLRFDSHLDDRATTDFLGHITVGPEALNEGRVSVAETLVHEQFHRTQPAYTKTVSFWSGVITRTPVWRYLELPAYRAALDFLVALEKHAQENGDISLVDESRKEQHAVRASFLAFYKIPLTD